MAPVHYGFKRVLLLLYLGLLVSTSIVFCTNSEAQSQIQSQTKQFVSRRLLQTARDEEDDPKPKKKSPTNLSSSSSSLKNQTKLVKPKTQTNSTKTITATTSSTLLTKIQLKKLNSTSKSSNSTKSSSILTKKSSDLLKSSTSKNKTTDSISSKDTKSLLEKKPTELKSKSLEKSEDSDKKPKSPKTQKTKQVELSEEEEETQLLKKSKSKSSELKSKNPEKLQITEQKPKQQKTKKPNQPDSSTEQEKEDETEKKNKPQPKSKSNEVKPKTPQPKKTEEKKTQKLKQPEWMEQSEDDDLVAEFRELPYKFHQTIFPDLQRISTTSKVYLNRANKEITKGFKPWVGNKYAPTVASITCAAFILIPLALVSLLFNKFKAYFSLQKILIFIQVYLSIYFSILCLSSVVTGLEPLRFFYATSQSTYVWIQVLQTLAYVLYLLLLLMYLVVAFSKESGLGYKALGLAQTFVGFAIGLHYYVSVFHRAVLHQPPKTNWRIHGIYATCFLVICLFATADRRKKAYLEDGGEEGKKS